MTLTPRERREALCLVLGLLLVCVVRGGDAEHRPDLAWMRGYLSANGVGCCSVTDCKPAQVRLLAAAGDERMVEVNGVPLTLPAKSVHLSEDAYAYWCAKSFSEPPSREQTRCVFLAVGG